MAEYMISDKVYDSKDPLYQSVLAKAHRLKERPLCLCTQPPIPMYVAKIEDTYIVKRMPLSGQSHSPHCDSYEPPQELSGIGEVMGQAIKEDLESGAISLKLDFALTRRAGRLPPEPSDHPADTVKADTKKLTLRSVLHYLWDEAGMTRWSPRMDGKRSWFVLHKYLTQAATGKSTKGGALGAALFVPEAYYSDRKDDIARARNARFRELASADKGVKKLMILVGEVKEIGQARYGHKIVIKQMPDCPFLMDDALLKRLEKRFEVELTLWQAVATTHLMAIATFGIGAAGLPAIEEMALMLTTENWIPFENMRELDLIDRLTEQRRHFVKSMRYNMAQDRALATAVLTDTQPKPTALYMIDEGSTEEHLHAVEELTAGSSLSAWTWLAADPFPELPPSARGFTASP